jgi:hypothetical protein
LSAIWRTGGPLRLACALLSPLPGKAGVRTVGECFGSDHDQAVQCQLHVAGIYHALGTAQARYGLKTPSCQYPRGLEHGALVQHMTPDLRENVAFGRGMHMNVIIAASLLQSKTCTMGVAREADGYKAAGLLHQCQAGAKDHEAQQACAAYVRGLFEGLQQFSGFGGAREFTCVPERGPRIKEMLLAFIDEAVRDPKVQQLTAAEVMAMAMARKFPCRAGR